MKLSKDASFRTLVYNEALKAFDDDYNVLLLTLDSIMEQNGDDDLNTDFASSITTHRTDVTATTAVPAQDFNALDVFTSTADITDAIDGFDYFDEIGFIQIYLPFIDDVDFTQQPAIAICLDDVEETIGYEVQSDGSFRAIMIDEAYAENNPVWVISVNESLLSMRFCIVCCFLQI